MRTAVVGGTGQVGHQVVEAMRKGGHDVVVVPRSRGTDLTIGEGLDEALTGVETVVDVTDPPEKTRTTPAGDPEELVEACPVSATVAARRPS